MIDALLFQWGPLAALAVGVFAILDWTLTIVGARASRLVSERWAIEGSYELNPTWTTEIDRAAWFSPRFAIRLVVLVVVFELVWWLIGPAALPAELFAFLMGFIVLVQVPILMRHVVNVITFRALREPDAVEGSTKLRRWLAYRQSGWSAITFAVLWLALAGLTWQWFFLGGAAGQLWFGITFLRLSQNARQGPAQPTIEAAASTAR